MTESDGDLRALRSTLRGIVSHVGDAKRSAISVATMYPKMGKLVRALDEAEKEVGWFFADVEADLRKRDREAGS